ncbi:ATP-binding cassette domain-containing protein [Erysipelothrix sp. HDW6C]|uniref:oligopeptide/dipeptide ABC transporter ATP-binding protein n=1 Tax=Erysipelothrix sp. HDW6C TaxID=2714930 RepID=UPI001409BD63|nr:oligopeptide/dipeptide ABC transporter ATP-binding protein [Erysipelothrix sp. HDW6C]QIK70492.1 ATP-binding cassette domain-containing protein [Erysipelothrix sp. HDW6C]
MTISKDKVILKVEHLQKYFPIKKTSVFQRTQEYVKANKNITIDILEGETLGLVGESGCGKSTFGRTLIQLYDQTGGDTLYYGETIEGMMPNYVKKVYTSIPKVFPDHAKDKANLDALKVAAKTASGDAFLTSNEALRVARIDYDTKYGNIFRLAGGLLTHSNLDEVTKLLVAQYEKGSAVANLHLKIDAEEQRAKATGVASKTVDGLKKEFEAASVANDAAKQDVQKLKDTLVNNTDFDKFESKLDNGIDLSSLTKKEIRLLRKDLQIIFQDPYSSLDPRLTVGNIIGEGLIAHKIFPNNKSKEYNDYIIDIMEKCGLDAKFIHRYPHQFSGGQRQRIGIARALALNPKFIVCDEAVSALDVSIQSQVINLLQDLKEENNLTYLFITHDLGVVRYISDRIGVMYFGNLVELAPAEEIFSNPQHPYTKALLAAIPRMKSEEEEIQKILEETHDSRFDFTYKETGEADKDWFEVSPDHFVACRLLKSDEEVSA